MYAIILIYQAPTNRAGCQTQHLFLYWFQCAQITNYWTLPSTESWPDLYINFADLYYFLNYALSSIPSPTVPKTYANIIQYSHLTMLILMLWNIKAPSNRFNILKVFCFLAFALPTAALLLLWVHKMVNQPTLFQSWWALWVLQTQFGGGLQCSSI